MIKMGVAIMLMRLSFIKILALYWSPLSSIHFRLLEGVPILPEEVILFLNILLLKWLIFVKFELFHRLIGQWQECLDSWCLQQEKVHNILVLHGELEVFVGQVMGGVLTPTNPSWIRHWRRTIVCQPLWPKIAASPFNGALHRESKKQDTKLLAITSPTIIRFSKIFH